MKIIKKGKPYRIHKCSKCKTKYAFKWQMAGMGIVFCPQCRNFLDLHWYDKKISQEKYDKLEGNNE